METAASLIAFIQVAGKIVELIIEVNQLWGEAKDLPGDLRDILEELDDYALVFEELKEQIEYDQTHNTRSNGSCMSRSFMAATKAKEILKELVEEINMTIHSKKEGLQRRLSSFKLLMKKEKIERYQKRLQRSITLLQTAISTYQIAMMRQNTEIIVGRVTDNFSEKFEYLQLNQTSMLATSAAYQTEQKQLCGSSNSKQQELCTPQRGRLPSSKQYTSSWTGHFSMSRTSAEGAWQAYLQLPSWLSQSTHIFQSYPTRSGWTFNYRVYNIVAPDSEIIARIHNGDKNGVLELFSARKASPFDKDSDGASLLYHAARSKHYDICKLLLNMGLEDTLFEVVGRDRESPLKPLVYNPEKDAMGHDWERIVTLFQTYLQDPEDMPVTRLFDFLHEWAHSDNFVFIFRTRFMPKYYTWPSRIRFEAVRLGSFHLRSCASLPKLLSEDSKVSQLDVSLSSHENFSLLHSAAISLGIRFADEAIPKRRGEFQWGTYNDGWDDFVIDIASVSESEDLHHVEAVSPWDVYKVPQWKGTPLFSLLGGTLCYLTTGASFFHWNHVFQKTLHQWLGDLKIAGVDLLRYGTRERGFFRDHVLRGAFDSNAITSSRVLIREAMANGSYDTNVTHSLRENISENRWIPIRLVDLKVGEDITDWEILWAPEFEYMACEFWRLFEEEENTMIPGAWVED